MSPTSSSVMPASWPTVSGEESLFCLTDMSLARIRMKNTLQISAGWMLKGSQEKASQLRLPEVALEPQMRSIAMNSTQKMSSSSRARR